MDLSPDRQPEQSGMNGARDGSHSFLISLIERRSRQNVHKHMRTKPDASITVVVFVGGLAQKYFSFMNHHRMNIFLMAIFLLHGLHVESRSFRKKSNVPIVPIVAGVAAGAAAVPLFNAASNFLRSPMGYPMEITIVLADDGHEAQVGKFEIELHTLFFKQRLKMNHVELVPGRSYPFHVYSEYEIHDIRYVELEWKKRSWTNLLGSWAIHVNHLILDPVYIQDPVARAQNVRRLCANRVPFNMWHKEDVEFRHLC